MTMWRRFHSLESDISELPDAEPKVRAGRSRRRAWRDGLAVQTVIETIEDSRSYRSFECAIIASFGPRSVIELELIQRLASLLWRLRRANAIETGLFQIQTKLQGDPRNRLPLASSMPAIRQIPLQFSASEQVASGSDARCDFPSGSSRTRSPSRQLLGGPSSSSKMAQCFLRLFNLDASLLERVGAYEAKLWRQAAQTIWILDAMRRPQTPTRPRIRTAPARLGSNQNFWDPNKID